MQDLLDAQIPAVVLIPLLLGCFALWRCSQWMVHSNEVRRVEFLRLSRKAQEEQDRLERDHEQGYGSHQEFLRQRQGAQQRQIDDYRVDYRSQPVSGYDYPRRVQVEQDYRYADSYDHPRREDEESMQRRRWAEERRQAEAEEFRSKQAKELSWRKQVEVEELRKKLFLAEEEERRHREAADADIRMRLAEEAEKMRIAAEEEARRRHAEEEVRRRQAEEEVRRIQAEEEDRKRRQAAVDESNKKAEAEAQAKKMAEEEEIRKQKADEITQKGTQDDVGRSNGTKVHRRMCVVCQKQTKCSRCARCKSVYYW